MSRPQHESPPADRMSGASSAPTTRHRVHLHSPRQQPHALPIPTLHPLTPRHGREVDYPRDRRSSPSQVLWAELSPNLPRRASYFEPQPEGVRSLVQRRVLAMVSKSPSRRGRHTKLPALSTGLSCYLEIPLLK